MVLSVQIQRNRKIIDGIPCIRATSAFYTSKRAAQIARRLIKAGYYTRIYTTTKGCEIWISEKPEWFYHYQEIGKI